MKLADIEEKLAAVDLASGQDLIYELLAAYGIPQASITKLRSGTYNRAADDDTVLWKKKVWDTYDADADETELLSLLDRAQANADVRKLKPRFYIARSAQRLAAVDDRLGQTLDIPLTDLARHAAFFMPWAGAEKVQSETATYVDTKVANQMAKLYDEIIATNPDLPADEDGRRDLNLFFSRLLFCFFAEDTGVFPDGVFTDALTNLTANDGTDTATFLDDLFEILDTPHDQRNGVASHFEPFGYVNGSLFTDRINAPNFSRKARNIVVDCGTLDWSSINPDIFGSMIQAVTAGEDRANLGMHYTSVENILKVLNPLFLDDLDERYEDAEDSIKKLEALLDHLGEIKVFDPACGSGNFLIVAYKRLRVLEHRVLQRLVDLQGGEAPLFADSRISLESFYGIEIDDFAHDIAKLSLWFAKHQMNQEYDELFGIERPLIPLTETGAIACGNATRVDWNDVCPASNTTYVCGNPPYLGSKWQQANHKADFAAYFEGIGNRFPKNLDYVSLWFLKASDWLKDRSAAAFVSTNSICQGQHVGMLWPLIAERGVEISFAHTSFLWSNSASGGAGVTCIVVGLQSTPLTAKPKLYIGRSRREVQAINGYLTEGDTRAVVATTTPLSDRPAMAFGCRPVDDGQLLLTSQEREVLLRKDIRAAPFVRSFLGAKEMLSASERFCLWISDADLVRASEIPAIADRIERVRNYRSASTARDTPKWADRGHRFIYINHSEQPYIGVPAISSERRQYIPLAYFGPETVVSNKIYAVNGADHSLFGLLHSLMHVAWIKTICGRMKSDYSYGNTLGYNTFPFPELNDGERSKLADSALAILAARERWPDRSLAELYDPDKMPANLRAAHEANDALVDSLYRSKPFTSDADRMELLLAMYRDLVAEADSKKSKKV